ncbi:MAG: alkaline phosphatase [Pseudomonadales bacterium]|nr:alkaline phosphatase [Pseudomonadales bacterium]
MIRACQHAALLLAIGGAAMALGADPAPRDAPADDWAARGASALAESRALFPGMPERARNVILFVGDGMGITTITAARILEGQRDGGSGEDNSLAFERLPFVALSKTYSANQQTPDSAPTMSAMMTGIKTNDGVISIAPTVPHGEPARDTVAAAAQPTLLELAEGAGLATGVVSTARLTHATPAACYAHTSARDWEADSDRPADATVPDIAAQLIDRFGPGGIGDGLEVALGGGREKFLPARTRDPEDRGERGVRRDGRDLTREWRRKFGGSFVHDRAGFEAIDPARSTHLLGLFERSHMEYEADRARDTGGEPSLAEMTAKAIDILARNPRGWFLMVEGGRIDHGHHAGNAYRALTDTIALSDAVRAALAKVDLRETLVIVTADHSHVFTMAGYPACGNPILGKVVEPGASKPALAADGRPYTTLGYANGAGLHDGATGAAPYPRAARSGRVADLGPLDTAHADFHQEALVPLASETHGGEDVAIFAGGPSAQHLHGVQEQSHVFYVMRAALGL